MELGTKIRALRLKANATQDALAQALGVSSQAVSKWENNLCAPDIALLPKISEYFGVMIDDLFDLTVEQKLNRIGHMVEFETELSGERFANAEAFLKEHLADYDKTAPDEKKGRIESLLAHLYHHRMMCDAKKVSDYARRAMRLHPGVKEDQWLLQDSEHAWIEDWNIRNHHKAIDFYMEQVRNYPEISRNYLYLMDNLLADCRTEETRHYLNLYKRTADAKPFYTPCYEARIALAEHDTARAKRFLEEMERDFPNDAGVLFELANFAAGACRYDEALACYEKSYELDEKPRFSDPLMGEATIYEILGDYPKAIECCERMLQNCAVEWGRTEGAFWEEIEGEKKRLEELAKGKRR